MTEPVATNGFNGVPGASTVGGSIAPQAPTNQPVPIPAPQSPSAPPQAPQGTSGTPEGDQGFAAAIAALTAALQPKQGTPEAPQEGTPEIPEVPGKPETGPLNDLNAYDIADPVIRSMALALQTGVKGLDVDRALGVALERGDPSLIDRAYLVEKFGADAQHRITLAEGIIAAVNAKATEAASAVYALAGGKESWRACSAAFNNGAPQALKAVVVNMLNSGDTGQVSAASQLVVEFAKGQGIVPNSNPLVSAGATVPAGQALSKAQFQAELFKLDKDSADFAEQQSALFARRALGRKLGK